MKRKPGRQSLYIVRQFFPQVDSVVDAKASVTVIVTPEDSRSGKPMDPVVCGFARAAYRRFHDLVHAAGVLIGLKVSYVIKGTVATRYHNNESISREIISNDRKAGFYPGRYVLNPVSPSHRLGISKLHKVHAKKNGQDRRSKFRHYTENVRVLTQVTEI